jgi:hypothetical protein
VYRRKDGAVSEHLLPPHPLLEFRGGSYRRQMQALLDPVLAATPA